MSEVMQKARKAKESTPRLAVMSSKTKDDALEAMAKALENNVDMLLSANKIDVDLAEQNQRSKSFIDRLLLNEMRIKDMAQGLRVIAGLSDPIGEVLSMWRRPNGLEIGQKRVPIGVIGIIYEARPNVTADAAALCLKTGNAVILKGGSEAIRSNQAIVEVLSKAASNSGIPDGTIQLIENTDRTSAQEMMKMNGLIDVLIPRGGANLIKTVVEYATIPVIETGVGNCHIYVNTECDQEMALNIVYNAKTQRPAVCNAAETLLVDEAIAEDFLPKVAKRLREKNVEIRGCEKTALHVTNTIPATEDDWYTEYLDYIISVKVVKGLEEAIEHINKYGTKHSEAIVTSSYFNAQKFLNEIDAAAVYVNASTRFTDGYEFGFGAEIGISTQKLHARGPMGLKELTTTKYIIYGNGQIR